MKFVSALGVLGAYAASELRGVYCADLQPTQGDATPKTDGILANLSKYQSLQAEDALFFLMQEEYKDTMSFDEISKHFMSSSFLKETAVNLTIQKDRAGKVCKNIFNGPNIDEFKREGSTDTFAEFIYELSESPLATLGEIMVAFDRVLLYSAAILPKSGTRFNLINYVLDLWMLSREPKLFAPASVMKALFEELENKVYLSLLPTTDSKYKPWDGIESICDHFYQQNKSLFIEADPSWSNDYRLTKHILDCKDQSTKMDILRGFITSFGLATKTVRNWTPEHVLQFLKKYADFREQNKSLNMTDKPYLDLIDEFGKTLKLPELKPIDYPHNLAIIRYANMEIQNFGTTFLMRKLLSHFQMFNYENFEVSEDALKSYVTELVKSDYYTKPLKFVRVSEICDILKPISHQYAEKKYGAEKIPPLSAPKHSLVRKHFTPRNSSHVKPQVDLLKTDLDIYEKVNMHGIKRETDTDVIMSEIKPKTAEGRKKFSLTRALGGHVKSKNLTVDVYQGTETDSESDQSSEDEDANQYNQKKLRRVFRKDRKGGRHGFTTTFHGTGNFAGDITGEDLSNVFHWNGKVKLPTGFIEVLQTYGDVIKKAIEKAAATDEMSVGMINSMNVDAFEHILLAAVEAANDVKAFENIKKKDNLKLHCKGEKEMQSLGKLLGVIAGNPSFDPIPVSAKTYPKLNTKAIFKSPKAKPDPSTYITTFALTI